MIFFLLLLALIAALLFTIVGEWDGKTVVDPDDTIAVEGDMKDFRRYGYRHDGKYEYSHNGSKESCEGYYKENERVVHLSPFDPNTADSTQLLNLGLAPWQVRNIYKYRAKGGIYRKPDDFAKLYGLTAGQYKRLEPYIRISSDYRPASELVSGEKDVFLAADKLQENDLEQASNHADRVRKISLPDHVVLNTADTTALKTVPGIGSWRARAIIRYGERLGGYVSVEQLTEIDDFPKEALSYFVVINPQIKKLNLNRLSLNELRNHPYINFYQAKAICDYRRLKGRMSGLQDLHLLQDFSAEAIERLAPYVEFW